MFDGIECVCSTKWNSVFGGPKTICLNGFPNSSWFQEMRSHTNSTHHKIYPNLLPFVRCLWANLNDHISCISAIISFRHCIDWWGAHTQTHTHTQKMKQTHAENRRWADVWPHNTPFVWIPWVAAAVAVAAAARYQSPFYIWAQFMNGAQRQRMVWSRTFCISTDVSRHKSKIYIVPLLFQCAEDAWVFVKCTCHTTKT